MATSAKHIRGSNNTAEQDGQDHLLCEGFSLVEHTIRLEGCHYADPLLSLCDRDCVVLLGR